MPELTEEFSVGLLCERQDCHVRETWQCVPSSSDAHAALLARCLRDGWTCWLGRSRRWYCPDHNPAGNSRHTMRDLSAVLLNRYERRTS